MRPEDVPAELVEKAKPALVALLATEGVFVPLGHPRLDHIGRRILAAVLPEAMAEAWVEGRDDGLDDLGATQTAIDYGELTNPFEEPRQ